MKQKYVLILFIDVFTAYLIFFFFIFQYNVKKSKYTGDISTRNSQLRFVFCLCYCLTSFLYVLLIEIDMLVSLVLFNIADLMDLVCLCEWLVFLFVFVFYYDDLFYFIRISNTLHIYIYG